MENPKDAPVEMEAFLNQVILAYCTAGEYEASLRSLQKKLGTEYDRLPAHDKGVATYSIGCGYFWEHNYPKSFQLLSEAQEANPSALGPDDFLIYVAGLAGEKDWLAAQIKACPAQNELLRNGLMAALAWANRDYQGVVAMADVSTTRNGPSGGWFDYEWRLKGLATFLQARAFIALGNSLEATKILLRIDRRIIQAWVQHAPSEMVCHVALVSAQCAEEVGEWREVRDLLRYLSMHMSYDPRRSQHNISRKSDWEVVKDLERRLRVWEESGAGGAAVFGTAPATNPAAAAWAALLKDGSVTRPAGNPASASEPVGHELP
ncbi:MAG: hypothetical protein NT031_12650 [Planctomycetota bacterium]|nr:hypothetical protein [Planctomycetota bacterium]